MQIIISGIIEGILGGREGHYQLKWQDMCQKIIELADKKYKRFTYPIGLEIVNDGNVRLNPTSPGIKRIFDYLNSYYETQTVERTGITFIVDSWKDMITSGTYIFYDSNPEIYEFFKDRTISAYDEDFSYIDLTTDDVIKMRLGILSGSFEAAKALFTMNVDQAFDQMRQITARMDSKNFNLSWEYFSKLPFDLGNPNDKSRYLTKIYDL